MSRVKLVTFCKRKPGLDVEAFQTEWRGRRAESILRLPRLLGYVQSHVLPSGYRKREPFCDILEELWFDDSAALDRALECPAFAEALAGTRDLRDESKEGAFVTAEHLIKRGEPHAGGVKNVEFVKRRRDLPQLPVDEFHRYWREHHGPLAARIAPILRYVQSHSIDDPTTRAYDGIASTWFVDTDAMRASAETVEYRETRDDEDNFVATPLHFVITREHVLVEPPAL